MSAPQRIAIVGGGPVGMALALALHRHGIEAGIYEARTRMAVLSDARVLALSHGSVQMLDWLGAWQPLRAKQATTPIRTIHVSHRGGLGRTRITADEMEVDALGHVVPAQALIAVLDALVEATDIIYREGAQVDAGETAKLLSEHALIAWAEGAVDPLRGQKRDYHQHAVLCSATTLRPHGHVAWERFTDEGPVALLPLGGEYSVVLACADHELAEWMALDDSAFRQRLQARFGTRLTITGVGPRVSYPLGLRWRPSTVAPRQAWLGNAAQTLHPVAGQGFNLALRDVWQFADCVARAAGREADLTSPAVLREYAAGRELDRRSTIGFTDTLFDTFGSGFGPVRHARGAGLLALDMVPGLRRFVARRMMFGARSW